MNNQITPVRYDNGELITKERMEDEDWYSTLYQPFLEYAMGNATDVDTLYNGFIKFMEDIFDETLNKEDEHKVLTWSVLHVERMENGNWLVDLTKFIHDCRSDKNTDYNDEQLKQQLRDILTPLFHNYKMLLAICDSLKDESTNVKNLILSEVKELVAQPTLIQSAFDEGFNSGAETAATDILNNI